MSLQEWVINAEITANFILVEHQDLSYSKPAHESVTKFVIQPEFDVNNNQTGKFQITLHFTVDEENNSASSIAYLGRDIFNIYIDLLCFLSGSPVLVNTPPTLIHHFPGTHDYRHIKFPSAEGFLEPPVPLVTTAIFNTQLDSKKGRILAWFRKGLGEKDVVSSILSLFIALEILSKQFKSDNNIIRTCKECGHKTVLEPSTRQKIENFLVNIIGYSPSLFKTLWEVRNTVSHGGLDLLSEDLKDLHFVKQNLVVAIIKGLKILLNINSNQPPRESLPEWGYSDPILEVNFTLPEK